MELIVLEITVASFLLTWSLLCEPKTWKQTLVFAVFGGPCLWVGFLYTTFFIYPLLIKNRWPQGVRRQAVIGTNVCSTSFLLWAIATMRMLWLMM